NTYGNQAKRLPKRFSDGHRTGFTGAIRNSAVETDDGIVDLTDRRPYIEVPLGQGGARFGQAGAYARPVPGEGQLARIWNVPLLNIFYQLPGVDPMGRSCNTGPSFTVCTPNTDPGRADNDLDLYAGAYIAKKFEGYRFGVKQIDGVSGGEGTSILGPWRPIDRIVAYGALADRPNPYAADRLDGDGILPSVVLTPVEPDPVTGIPALTEGTPELAFRPATANRFTKGFDIRQSQGLYYPTAALKRFFDEGAQVYDQNFSQTDLAWNNGASQSDDRVLRDAYLDIELFDGRLWLRLGKQLIVWGKTELFRAVDQFNPQDLGLASLPSLEESRIPMWAARIIYSIGDIGPIQDLRIEGAVLLDQYEPADIGRCGEPYSPIVTCGLSAGLLAHALTGTGLAGEVRPPDPWDDVNGLEGGLRIEWRAGRFSFALSDYYGYQDFPYIDQLNVWERNVDPLSGRPRIAGSRGRCLDGTEFDCLGARSIRVCDPSESDCVNSFRLVMPALGTAPLNPLHRTDVLNNHFANQQLFATICAGTTGLDNPESACGFTVWNSTEIAAEVAGAPPFSSAFSSLLSGGTAPGFLGDIVSGQAIFNQIGRFEGPFRQPLVRLDRNSNIDPDTGLRYDGRANGRFEYAIVGVPFENDLFRQSGLAPYLTDQQEALLGCGRFWGNPCDVTGFDLFNAEASVFFQSWPGFEGTGLTLDAVRIGNSNRFETRARYLGDWDTFVGNQPGTTEFGTIEIEIPTRDDEQFVIVDGVQLPVPAGEPLVVTREIDVGPVCTRFEGGTTLLIAGCEDSPGTPQFNHPFFGSNRVCPLNECLSDEDQFFATEMAALSFNALMTFVVTSAAPDVIDNAVCLPGTVVCIRDPDGMSDREPYFNEFDFKKPYRRDGCSLRKPLLCANVAAFLSTSGTQRNAIRAGGNPAYGRRDFLWHSGAVVGLRRYKSNALAFAFDFAEDYTKTAWSFELSWLSGLKVGDFNERDGRRTVDQINLVMSVDRSTFINFLNKNRTFFINSQIFLRYIPQYRKSMALNGPVNVLATLGVFTGYFQDRLNPSLITVRDFQSKSGAVISSLTYRYNENFSATVGLAWFYGRVEKRPYPLTPVGAANGGAGKGSYTSYVQNGLSIVRDRDEVFMQLRYTF
ncbi:MAG: DUF1302 family protein, partial [Myxococcota bacterium]